MTSACALRPTSGNRAVLPDQARQSYQLRWGECFVFVQSRTDHDRAPGVRFVNGATAMAEGFLGKPLRIAATPRALCPRVRVRMQSHAAYTRDSPTPAKLRGAHLGRFFHDLWEQWTGAGE